MIHYTIQGSGPVLLAIHGFPNDQRAWDNIKDELCKHFTLILVDLPGAGKSKDLFNPNLTMNDLGDAIMEVIRHEELSKLHLMGHSMGGYTCMNIFERFPEYISSITLVHSGATADAPEKFNMRQKSIQLMLKGDKEQMVFLKALFNNFFYEDFIKNNKQIIEYYVNRGMELPKEHLAAFYNAIAHRKDYNHLIANTTIPFHWILGTHDTAVTLDSAIKEVSLPQISCVSILENCGHCAMEEMPDELSIRIISFLNKFSN